MAEAETVKDQLLTCSICSDLYTDPCTLGCGHTFCRKCLTQFIETRPGDIQAGSMPCAYCRQASKVPDTRTPVEEWAGQFKPSILMQGLMDIMLVNSKNVETGHGLCFLCGEIGETTPAISWCAQCQIAMCRRCAKQHVKTPSMRDHTVDQLNAQELVERTKRRTCPEHDGEHIKFVCKDCDKPVCQQCCILLHRSCKSIVSIASMVPEMNSRLDSLKQFVKMKIKDNVDKSNNEESMMKDVAKCRQGIDSEIHATIDQAVALLRKKEEELIHELSSVSEDKQAYHKANIKALQIEKQMHQEHEAFIDQAQISQSVAELFDMYQICTSGVLGSVDGGALDEKPMLLVQNKAAMARAIDEICILRRSSVSTPSLNIVGMKSPLQQCDTIGIKHERDSHKPDPLDVLVVRINDEDVLVVVDFKNESLKSAFTKDGVKHVDLLKLNCLPLRLTSLNGSRVAVTVGDSRILIVDVRPQLRLVSHLKTRRQYWSLASLDESTLAVGVMKCIDIIDLEGNVIRSFKSPGGISPYYLVTTPEGNIVGTGSTGVFGVTPYGEPMFNIGPTAGRLLDKPYGVTVTESRILVTDPGSKCIHQISTSGEYLGQVATFVDGENVWGIFLFAELLYAGDRNGHISVYK